MSAKTPEPSSSVALHQLLQQYLLGRTDGLGAREVAAFLSGWQSALDLMRRVDIVLGDTAGPVRDVVVELVSAIEQAGRHALEDAEPTGHGRPGSA